MKKITFAALVLISFFSNAQAYRDNDMLGHEIKFNIGIFLANTTIEGSYEYFLNEDTSIGGLVYFDDSPADFNGNFGIGSNFRAYFGRRPNSGFYAEVFGLYHSGEIEETFSLIGSSETKVFDYSSFALGLGAGNKWTTRSQRFTFEFNIGFGRNINTIEYQDSFIIRGGLSVGYRFL